jgi:hypothetical protein
MLESQGDNMANDSNTAVLFGHLTSSTEMDNHTETALALVPPLANILSRSGPLTTISHACICGAMYALLNISALVNISDDTTESICDALFVEDLLRVILELLCGAARDATCAYYATGILANLVHTSKVDQLKQIVSDPRLFKILSEDIVLESDVEEHATEYLIANLCGRITTLQYVLDSGVLDTILSKELYFFDKDEHDSFSKVFVIFSNVFTIAAPGLQTTQCLKKDYTQCLLSDLEWMNPKYKQRVQTVYSALVAFQKKLRSESDQTLFASMVISVEQSELVKTWIDPADFDEHFGDLSRKVPISGNTSSASINTDNFIAPLLEEDVNILLKQTTNAEFSVTTSSDQGAETTCVVVSE